MGVEASMAENLKRRGPGERKEMEGTSAKAKDNESQCEHGIIA